MKILCSLSSIEFSCEHFPGSLYSREAHHPVFQVPQKKLLSYLGKWSQGHLTPTDSYLLFLALLRSTDLVEFRVPAIRTQTTDALVASYMEALAKCVSKINSVTNPSAAFPHYVISQDTRGLENISAWIENWESAYQDFRDGYRSAHDSAKLISREAALERLIKNPHRPISSYASQIADWAAVAGSFPVFTLVSPFSGFKVSCLEYWKVLIAKCAHEESIFSIRRKDLEELLEHCEEFIPVGSIYSNALFKILRHALERQRNYLGLGDLDLSRGTYEIIRDRSDVESANLSAMVQSAPAHAPTPGEYPDKLSYLRAKMRWELSQKASKQSGNTDPTTGV